MAKIETYILCYTCGKKFLSSTCPDCDEGINIGQCISLIGRLLYNREQRRDRDGL